MARRTCGRDRAAADQRGDSQFLWQGQNVFGADSDDVRAGWPAGSHQCGIQIGCTVAIRTGGFAEEMVWNAAAAGGELRLAGADRNRPGEASSLSHGESSQAVSAQHHTETDTQGAGTDSAFQRRI